ncbi:hypothetical protein [Magnetovibrio sp.]|uniref:hypothetical protein n=1 Tax=Magnetovibrio sp. TaxID=2024836 RepID=UPI002F95E821
MSYTDRTDGHQVKKKMQCGRLVSLTLTASLALNLFGLAWFATQAIVKQASKDPWEMSLYSQTQVNSDIGILEGLLIKRLTANLSPQGVETFLRVYAKHMSSLSGMDSFIVGFHADLAAKIRSENVTEQELREALKPLPIAVMVRVSVMTKILAEAIPLLSVEDRMSLPPMGEFASD